MDLKFAETVGNATELLAHKAEVRTRTEVTEVGQNLPDLTVG
jgi:hypothetical protein